MVLIVLAHAGEGVIAALLQASQGLLRIPSGQPQLGEAVLPAQDCRLAPDRIVDPDVIVHSGIPFGYSLGIVHRTLDCRADEVEATQRISPDLRSDAVRQDDDAKQGLGLKTKMGVEAGTTTAMADEGAIAFVGHSESQTPRRLPVGIDPLHSLHLSEGRSAQEFLAAVRQQAELPTGEPGQVLDGRRKSGRGCDALDLEDRDDVASAVAPARAVSHGQAVAWHVLGNFGEGAGHPQRLEDVGANVVSISLPRGRGHDLPGQRQPQVRVLKVARGGVERLLLGKAGDDLVMGRKGVGLFGPVGVVRLARQT